MTVFLEKFRALESHYSELSNRFSGLEPNVNELEYPSPNLISILNQNKRKIDRQIPRIQRMIYSAQNNLSPPSGYRNFINSLMANVKTREEYYDALRQATFQRKNPELNKTLLAADIVLQEILHHLDSVEKPVIVSFSSMSFPGYMSPVSKRIGLPYSSLSDVSYMTIIAHETAHEILFNFSASIRVLFWVAFRSREELSRRYGIRRVSFDTFVDAVESNSNRVNEFIDDMKRYFLTHPWVIGEVYHRSNEDDSEERQLINSLMGNVVEFLSGIREFIPGIEEFFEDIDSREEVENRLNWIEEIVCDLVETKMMGPASFNTAIKISNIDTQLEWSGTHPPDIFRLRFSRELLESIGLGGVIEDQWNNWLAGLDSETKAKYDRNIGNLMQIFNFMKNRIDEKGIFRNSFTREDYTESERVAERLSNGEAIEAKKASIILNAAQIAIQNGSDASLVNRVAIESLCNKKI